LDVLLLLISNIFFVLVIKAKSSHSWNPTWVFFLKKIEYNGLYTGEVRAILGVEMNDVEYVLPKVVIALDVLVETSLSTFAVIIENEFLDVADVADVLHVIVVSTNGVSQTSKGVNNNTKDNVQTGNVDNNLETCIMYQLHQVLFFVIFVMNNCGNISDSTTHSHSFVEHSHVALEHVGAVVLSNDIRVIGIDSEIIHSILNVKEGKSTVNVNNDHH